MPLRSLVLSRDSATVQFLTRGLKEFLVDVEPCSDPQHALKRLKEQRFEAVVIDDEDRAGAILILESLGTVELCKNSLKIVVTDAQTALATAFGTGTHLVMYKPLSSDRLRHSLRALHTLMNRRIKRESARIRVSVPVMLQLPDNKKISASITEIGSGGVALSTQQVPATLKTLSLKFALPDRAEMIATSGEIVWSDVRGRVGVQFVDMEPTTRVMLSHWVDKKLMATRLQKRTARSQA